ncbi:hypothetical protein [Mucilaginibacter puniceus]
MYALNKYWVFNSKNSQWFICGKSSKFYGDKGKYLKSRVLRVWVSVAPLCAYTPAGITREGGYTLLSGLGGEGLNLVLFFVFDYRH